MARTSSVISHSVVYAHYTHQVKIGLKYSFNGLKFQKSIPPDLPRDLYISSKYQRYLEDQKKKKNPILCLFLNCATDL